MQKYVTATPRKEDAQHDAQQKVPAGKAVACACHALCRSDSEATTYVRQLFNSQHTEAAPEQESKLHRTY